jgi:hypothetical protein
MSLLIHNKKVLLIKLREKKENTQQEIDILIEMNSKREYKQRKLIKIKRKKRGPQLSKKWISSNIKYTKRYRNAQKR